VDLSLAAILPAIVSNPILIVIIIMSMGVCVVNGATVSAALVATTIATRSISPKKAIILAVVCDFAGIIIMSYFSTAVAGTILNMVDFGGDNHQALVALMAAMVAIIVWSIVAWAFKIPSSQSHALIAGLTGAAVALQMGFGGVNWAVWMRVIYGLVVSLGLGFGLGWLSTKILGRLCRNLDHRKVQGKFRVAQIVTAGTLVFMHGSQDGQKFMAICLLGIVFALGGSPGDFSSFPLWLMILSGASLAIGTACFGSRIIKSVGMDMVKLERWQGFAATLSSTISIFVSTITGLPISVTHANTTAVMGVGSAKRLSAVKWGKAKNMVLTWIFTFPGCGIIAFGLVFLFEIFL
jgi:PiT family inorganic phosphate transporter